MNTDMKAGRSNAAPSGAGEAANRIMQRLVFSVALLLALFHLYTAAFGSFVAIAQRSYHLAISIALIYLLKPGRRHTAWSAPLDIALAAAAAVTFLYVALDNNEILLRMTFITPLSSSQFILGLIAIALVLEAARRSLGWTMAILPLIALLYALLGDQWSGFLSHRGFSLSQVTEYMYLGTEGLFGIPVGIAATYLVLLVLFGTVMERAGVGDFIMRFALALAGRTQGGPAQVAVIASALFGSVSGSAVANVYASGTSSIPLMKRCGFRPTFAASVEAVASTGGQLMPPVLGAAAFIMADMIGVPYLTIVTASAIPALLYFLSVGMMVHFESARMSLPPLAQDEIPKLRDVMRDAYMLLPLIGICVLLFLGYSVSRSALIGILLAWLVSLPRKRTRLGLKATLEALALGAKRAVVITVATACASLIVGVFTLTGLGLSLTSFVALAFNDQLFAALLCTALASIILGMGLPTVVSYLLVATLVTPMLGSFGVSVLAAHMFAFYFGVLSMITPPVAIAAWAGAQLAESNFLRTSMVSTRLGLVAFVVPFAFIYNEALLGQGTAGQILFAAITACIGTVAISAGLQGWLLRQAGLIERGVLMGTGLALIWHDLWMNVAGLTVLALLLFLQWYRYPSRVVRPQAAQIEETL